MSNLFAQELPVPTVFPDTICGAGSAVLRATSDLDSDPDLMYNWYSVSDDTTILIKTIESGTFITPEIITPTEFGVSISLNGEESEVVKFSAHVEHTATLQEAPRITLCDSVILHASTNFSVDDLSTATYQWQRYEAKENEEGAYRNISDPSSQEGLNYVTKKAGFYRIVITRSDGCKAISAGIEVTNEDIIEAEILGAGNLCFIQEPGDEVSYSALSSEYGREITTYLWEESPDGINYTNYSTGRTAVIYNPTPDGEDSSTVYYRLTVMEQTCSLSVVDTVYWIRSPEEPLMTRLGSTDDFFYCETDDEDQRTLKVTSSETGVEYAWLRIQDEYTSYEILSTTLKDIDPFLLEEFFWPVAYGDSIVLGKDDWGLYVVAAIDTLTGCYNYSNRIFADGAIPVFSSDDLDNVICLNLETPTLSAFDPTADTYSWLFSETKNGTYDEISTEQSITLNPPSTTGSGYYLLHVTKNGCENTSDTLFVDESEIPFPTITSDKPSICPGESVMISSSIQDTDLYTYEWTNSFFPLESYGEDPEFTTSDDGVYRLLFSNEHCTYVTNALQIEELDAPDAGLNTDSLDVVCGPYQIELSSVDLTDSYQWYFSTDKTDFTEIAEADSSVYNAETKGFYYLEATSADGCTAVSRISPVIGITSSELNTSADTVIICGATSDVVLALVKLYPDNTYQWMYSMDSINYVLADGVSNESSYTASVEGFYKVQSTDSICSSESEAVFVQINNEYNPTFEAEIIGEGLLCIGTESVFYSSYISESAEFNWYYSIDNATYSLLEDQEADSLILDTTPLDSLIVGSTASFYIQMEVSDSSCFAVSEPFRFTLYKHTAPVLASSGGDDICGPYPLEVFNEDANSDYQWYHSADSLDFEPINGETSSDHLAISKGHYYVVSTSAEGCPANSESVYVSGVTASEIQLFSDTATICGNSGSVTLRISTYPDNVHSWMYSEDGITFGPAGGENDQSSYTTSEEGYYKVQTTDGPCSTESQPVYVEIDTEVDPTIDAIVNGEQTLCFGSTGTFSSELKSETATYGWLYSFDEVSYFTIEDEVDDTLLLDTDLFASRVTSDSLIVYLQLAVTDSSCVIISEPYPFKLYDLPKVRAQSPGGSINIFFCDPTNLGSLVTIQTSTNLPLNYQWQYRDLTGEFIAIDSENGMQFEPQFPGVYRCLTSVHNTCETPTNEVRIRSLPRTVDQIGDTFCYGDTIRLRADPGYQLIQSISTYTYWWFASTNGGASFSQIPANDDPFLTINPGSQFYGNNQYYFVTSYQGCTVTSDTLTLTGTEIPAYDLVITDATCEGVSDGIVSLDFSEEFTGTFSLVDTLDQTEPLFENIPSGIYWITISTLDGCGERVFFEVQNATSPEITITTGEDQIKGLPFEISASGAETYHWYPEQYFGDPENQTTYATIPESYEPDSIFLTVEARTPEGCEGFAQIMIRLSEIGQPAFSKFISPNGDGQNDHFEILGVNDQVASSLQILDNWGKEVYATKNYRNNSSQSEEMGNLLKEGIYFYIYKSDELMLKGSFYVKK